MTDFATPHVAAAFDDIPLPVRMQLLAIRRVIFDVADSDPAIGPLEETLKWGQPSYLTSITKSGTTLRLGPTKDGAAAVLVHCQTSLVSDFQKTFGDAIATEGSRALLPRQEDIGAVGPLASFVHSALVYHKQR